jgi:hypothetical protein
LLYGLGASNASIAATECLMRCRYCHSRAGLFRSGCGGCLRIVEVFEQSVGRVGWTELVDRFVAAGFTKFQVDRVLDAELGGEPSLRDRMTAEMANELLRNLGMPGRQSPADVRRIRLASITAEAEGTWNAGESPSCSMEAIETTIELESQDELGVKLRKTG